MVIDVSRPQIVVEPPGPKAKEWIEKDHEFLSTSLTRTAPLVPSETWYVWIKDVDGNVYLDFGSGIAVVNVGHRHPKIVEAIKKAADILDHTNSCDFYNYLQVMYAEKLIKTVPGNFKKRIFYGNSGTEAVECALKAVRWHSRGKPYIMGFVPGFHGRTFGSLTFTTTKLTARRGFFPFVPGAVHVPFPNTYRCPFKGLEGDQCVDAVLSYIEDFLFQHVVPPDEVAGLLIEPILGAGGVVPAPERFLRELYKLSRKYGFYFIADEVQTGFARTGKMWAIGYYGIEPDVITMSKAIANGLPMGACVAKAELLEWDPDAHENTLGANPIIISAALAVLDVIQEEKLAENAARQGEYMMKRLSELQERFEAIGDVRGKGLMIGVEFVKNKDSKEPWKKLRNLVIDEAFKRGLVILGSGISSLRIQPPLVIKREHVDIAMEIFEEALKAALSKVSK
jgi:4-aminobutyrate aminotransferase